MSPNSTSSREPRWPLILLAIVGVLILSPLLFASLLVGFALTVGLAGMLLKAGAVVLVLWAAVMLFKRLFGSGRPARLPPPARVAPRPQVDPEAELERERRESLAALDRELALAVARKQNAAAEQ